MMAHNEQAAIAGFFEEFDFTSLAKKVGSLKNNPPQAHNFPSDVVTIRRSDDLTQNTSDCVTQIRSDGLTQIRSDRLTRNTSDRQAPSTTDGLTQNTSEGQIVTTSEQYDKSPFNKGVTRGQLPLLQWLIQTCGNQETIVTYKAVSRALSISERAVRTHMDALSKKNIIVAKVACRPNSLQPIGKSIRIQASAHLALSLTYAHLSSDVVTCFASERQNVRTSGKEERGGSDVLTQNTSLRQTSSSSSNLTTTTTDLHLDYFDEEGGGKVFDRLFLEEWEEWGLHPQNIQEHLAKDITLLQNIMDKTAYVIKQKEETVYAIQRKIGFLNKCLENEVCEVDKNFISRKEKLLIIKHEQIKGEIERTKNLENELKKSALELINISSSPEELHKIREQAIQAIKKDFGSISIPPTEAQIVSYEKEIFFKIAKDKKIL